MGIPSGSTAARRAASLFVKRHGLVPPVNILDLVMQKADVRRIGWPHESVDAVLTGLTTPRPVVLYRRTDNDARERFTLAHELAHITLPWHLPNANCTPHEGVLIDDVVGNAEHEADIFASCVLLPDAWLINVAEEHAENFDGMAAALSSAGVSTLAALHALRRVLLAGWVFVSYGGTRVTTTPGTSWARPKVLQPQLVAASLQREAIEHGVSELNGFPVAWYRLARRADLPLADQDPRTDNELLTEAIALSEPEEERRLAIARSCNGIVGGNFREAGGRRAVDTYAAMLHIFEKSEHARLLSQPDFRAWLARKALTIEGRAPKTR